MTTNRQIMMATDPAVALNVGIGGVASPGQTRVTLDPLQSVYTLGTNDLWVMRNGIVQPSSAYIEEDPEHVVFNDLLDASLPWIDEIEFRSALQGASIVIPPPTFLVQAVPPERPDNFGGSFEFS